MRRALLLTLGGVFLASAAYADITNIRFALHRKDEFISTKTVPSLCATPATITSVANYSPMWDGIPCTEYTVTGPAPGKSQIYIVIAGFDAGGVAGASFGIDYDGRAGTQIGVDPRFASFTLCADGLPFPNDGGFGDFPAPKGGLRLTWLLPEGCVRDQIDGIYHAVAGSIYMYAYSEDVVRLTPNNNLQSQIPELAVTNCGGITEDIAVFLTENGIDPHLICGKVHLGGDGSQGYCSCCVVPTKETTWGKIKTLYTD